MNARSHSQGHSGSRASAAALNLSEWFRQAQRLASLSRLHGPGGEEVVRLAERLVEDFANLVEYHAPIVLRITPVEIWLREEVVMRHVEGEAEEPLERGVPFLLYRDGVRGMSFDARASRADTRALLDALVTVAGTPGTDEDLTTLLWRADLDGLSVEVAPLEELAPRAPRPEAAAAAPHDGPAHAEAEAAAAPAALDEWLDAQAPGDPVALWQGLRRFEAASLESWQQAWREAAACRWPERVELLVRDVLVRDGSALTREALTTAVASWLGGAAQRGDWGEAAQAHECVRRTDPDRRWSGPLLASALAALDAEIVAERLDHADHEAQGRFFALAVRIGHPAVDLMVRVLAHASRQRVRAAATTALSYVCGDDPALLAPYLRDARWHVARNVVFALGQMGGDETGEPLAFALHHPDVRVRRAAVAALGQVPVHRRTPLLLRELDTADGVTLASILGMLAREPDPRTAAELLTRIASADFESRPQDVRLSFIDMLGEIADDRALPALETLLNAGGWFARRTPDRNAAAQALARIGTPAAMELLHAGLRARAESVRAACQEALERREKSA